MAEAREQAERARRIEETAPLLTASPEDLFDFQFDPSGFKGRLENAGPVDLLVLHLGIHGKERIYHTPGPFQPPTLVRVGSTFEVEVVDPKMHRDGLGKRPKVGVTLQRADRRGPRWGEHVLLERTHTAGDVAIGFRVVGTERFAMPRGGGPPIP